MQKSSWHYWQQWRQRFPLQRDVHFDQGILSNDYCRDCRYCCGPQDCATPFPMKLLPSQQHDHLERDFFLLAPDTACLDDRGCKSCGPEGCLLPRQRRPVACSLFPLVLLDTGLYLYKICPAVFFLPLGLAGVHLVFAFPMVRKVLTLFGLQNVTLFASVTALSFVFFAVIYAIIYRATSSAYFAIVSDAEHE